MARRGHRARWRDRAWPGGVAGKRARVGVQEWLGQRRRRQECGSPTALWVAEEMPVGWGDTYIQSIAGQNFDITNVPNGTYYVEVIANPEKVLHETTTSNDVSLRKVILGGTPGHRTVKVPAWHGIDPEP